ncbi:hypothetical protein V502_02632 [Pseudogymnoascus sp. VKM F-4520 (FW-2644)]|nr:hypothetical protein V502_02632 [Pseudogymnoascus sp. VKM F-4520 (FW-2644)]
MAEVGILKIITPKPDSYDESLTLLSNLGERSLDEEPGCLSYLVFRGTAGDIIIIKRYKDLESLKQHQDDEYVQKIRESIPMAKEPILKLFVPVPMGGVEANFPNLEKDWHKVQNNVPQDFLRLMGPIVVLEIRVTASLTKFLVGRHRTVLTGGRNIFDVDWRFRGLAGSTAQYHKQMLPNVLRIVVGNSHAGQRRDAREVSETEALTTSPRSGTGYHLSEKRWLGHRS